MKTKLMLVAAFASAFALFAAGPASAAHTETKTYNFTSVGQGDVGGFCFFHDPASVVPPQVHSCVEFDVQPGETTVDLVATDSTGAPVFISVQQDGNDNFDQGCGVINDFPVIDSAPGGLPAAPVTVFPWAGPAANARSINPPLAEPCVPGSTNLAGGSVTATFV